MLKGIYLEHNEIQKTYEHVNSANATEKIVEIVVSGSDFVNEEDTSSHHGDFLPHLTMIRPHDLHTGDTMDRGEVPLRSATFVAWNRTGGPGWKASFSVDLLRTFSLSLSARTSSGRLFGHLLLVASICG